MNSHIRRLTTIAVAAMMGLASAAAAHAAPTGDDPAAGDQQVLESGLTPDQAYTQSLEVLAASRAELARSQAVGPLSRSSSVQANALVAAASTSWPSYFSSSGLDAISCVVIVADLTSCNTAKNYAEAALNLAAARYPSSVHNGKGDAFRHCYWSGLMTVGLGQGTAERIGGNHEAVSSNPVAEQNMDKYNNGRGRWVGVTYGTTYAADVRCTGLLSTAKALGGLQTSL